jgi:hypothetical protein
MSLAVAYKKAGTQKEPSTSQSERAYKAFEFFFTVTIAIVGGLGYVRIAVMKDDPSLARQAMLGLAALQYLCSFFLIIAATAHLGSKYERWAQGVKSKEFWRWVEPWMMFFAYVVGSAVWLAAVYW